MSIKPILSVGIDVGTTSTHLTVSRLFLTNVSRATEPERIVIERQEIVYQSPIQLTPLLAGTIDAEGVIAFLQQQYQIAGLENSDITSGAVIVTGETALLRNAEVIAEKLSSLAGQFVVASAGPNLESVLAGRGSGAAEYSKSRGKTICSIDIGGGTSNVAIFKCGHPEATAAISIGGRFLCLSDDLTVLRISESGQVIGNHLGESLALGAQLDVFSANRLTDYAADCLVSMLTEVGYVHPLLITPPLSYEETIDEYWFSGGVAEIMSTVSSRHRDTEYGDIGVFLGRSLVKKLNAKSISFVVPSDPIRATVIGAGIHTLQLSGSTIAVHSKILPLLGIPVIRPLAGFGPIDPTLSPQCIGALVEDRVTASLKNHDLLWASQPVALFLPEIPRLGYSQLAGWATALAGSFSSHRGLAPLILLCTHDVGAALGQFMRQALPGLDVLCLDGIHDDMGGDYIDIGLPIANNQAVPVVIKDLVFGAHTSARRGFAYPR